VLEALKIKEKDYLRDCGQRRVEVQSLGAVQAG
jgi:hypothetical protein